MRRSSKWTVVGCLAVGALLLAGVAQAQESSIQGYVTDESNAALPGASVVVTNADTGISRELTTNAKGYYLAQYLQSGNYSVTASLEGMQTVKRENIRLLLGQALDVNLKLGVEKVTEAIVVTAESPLVEVSRTSAAAYVSEAEIEALPISGRDFKEFAFLAPTVQNDPVRGFVTMSGQRGIYSGMHIDGTDSKSAFFGYGRGGEATENDGLVVAQDSVKEFQVVTNGFNPEFGANSGGYINVVTKSGSNSLRGTAFYFFRDDSLAEDLPPSPLDRARGNTADRPVDEFERKNWGLSFGGPIKKDRTFFFFSLDQTERDEPFARSLGARGAYDAILLLGQTNPGLLNLIDGYTPNNDGVAAPDPLNGRTASGLFVRSVDNLILFGKIDHQIGSSHTLSARANATDYDRESTFKDEESEKLEDTESWVLSLVSVLGSNAVNEVRIQLATDNLDRLSKRVGEPITAQIRFRGRDGSGSGQLGKFDFLPIFVEEEKLQFQETFSYLFGDHDLKFGVDYQQDDLKQLFAGSRDGRYDFNTIADFLANNASNVRIYYGDVTFPNYDETQTLTAIYAQDTWRPNEKLTVNYGFRWGRTDNPGDLPHLFPEGRNIPDDDDNFAPRFGFAYSPGGTGQDVIRGGIGLFFGRTPSLLFASQVQQNGLFPNFGRINVSPGDPAFVPFGQPINNENPPADSPNSPSYVDPNYEDPETWRLNFGYERELKPNWAAGVDIVYAEGEKLQSNVELNRTLLRYDEFGRPVYSSARPDPAFNEIFVRRSIGESEYKAVTLKINRRFAGRFQLQAHYTWSEDKDTDSNERSATGVTVSDPTNPRYDWGLAERDVENRLVVSGLIELPGKVRVSGIAEYRSGRPWSAVDGRADFAYCGFGRLGFNCVEAYAVDPATNQLIPRNAFRNESIQRLDLRVSKLFAIGGKYEIELFGEVFNVFDQNSFEQVFGFGGQRQRDPSNSEFGLADDLVTTPRQIQLGARLSFN